MKKAIKKIIKPSIKQLTKSESKKLKGGNWRVEIDN